MAAGGVVRSAVGTVVNVILVWGSICYGLFIGCFLPCLRGKAAHTITQQFQTASVSASSAAVAAASAAPVSAYDDDSSDASPLLASAAAADADPESLASPSSYTGGVGSSGSGGDGTHSSGGNMFQAMDLFLWTAALAMPTSVVVAYYQYASLWTRSVGLCWTVGPVLALWIARVLFIRKRVSFHTANARRAAIAAASCRGASSTGGAVSSGGGGGGNAGPTHTLSIGLFHPNCEQGGGGERVLWSMVHHLATAVPQLSHAHFYIYTQRPRPVVTISADLERIDRTRADGGSHIEILQKVRHTFGFNLLGPETRERLHFIWLDTTAWLDSGNYRRFTLILQALGSVIPAMEALARHNPHILIDTCGYPFIYPVFRWLGGCRTMCYTHYPTISADMLSSATTTAGVIKRWYYRLFAQYYALIGGTRSVSTVMVNSRWTMEQLRAVWGVESSSSSTAAVAAANCVPQQQLIECVYPPCMVNEVSALSLTPREPFILSVAQFRPEKRHDFQLQVFARVCELYCPPTGTGTPKPLKLVLVGTLRDRDRPLKNLLESLAVRYRISDRVLFETDVDNASLRTQFLGKALIGLHTMRDEHFGIGVVELMASGVITIANRSGGPLMDIVVPAGIVPSSSSSSSGSSGGGGDMKSSGSNSEATGYLCSELEEYAQAIVHVLRTYDANASSPELESIQRNARRHVVRFSEESFRQALDRVLVPKLTLPFPASLGGVASDSSR